MKELDLLVTKSLLFKSTMEDTIGLESNDNNMLNVTNYLSNINNVNKHNFY
jgi:hypothetical protein